METNFLDILLRVILERGRLANMMILNRMVSEEERKVTIEDHYSLVS